MLLLGLTYFTRIYGKATDPELLVTIQRLGDSSVVGQAVASETGIAGLESDIALARRKLEDLRGDLALARGVNVVAGWVPYLGTSSRAADAAVRRSLADIAALEPLVRAARGLWEFRQDIAADGISLDAVSGQAFLDPVLESRRLVEESAALLRDAREIDLPGGPMASPVRSRLQDLTAAEERLDGLLTWLAPALDTVEHLALAARLAPGLVDLFDTELPQTEQEIQEMLKTLSSLESEASQAAASGQEAVARQETGTGVAGFERDIAAAAALSDGIARGATAARLALEAALSAVEGVRQASAAGPDSPGPLLRLAELLEANRPELDRARILLDEGRESVRAALEVGGPLIPSGLAERAIKGMARAHGALRTGLAAISVAPSVFGSDEPVRYLMLGMNADELRPTGGYIANVWVITMHRSRVVGVESRDVVEIDNLTDLASYPPTPPLLRAHMNAPVLIMRDITWDPHFPAVARLGSRLFELGGGQPVDGVLAINQWAAQRLVSALGTVETRFGPVGGQDFLAVLREGTDRDGRAFNSAIMLDLLNAFESYAFSENAVGFVLALRESLKLGDLLAAVDDPEARQLVSDQGWDGAMAHPEHDRLTVLDSNIGWNRVDINMIRSVRYEVDLRGEGRSTARVSLSYVNTGEPKPEGCGPQWRPYELNTYLEAARGCYWDLVRTYIAPGAAVVGAEPVPLPEGSVAEQTGFGRAGEDTFIVDSDDNGDYVAGLLAIEAGSGRSMSWEQTLPDTVLRRIGESATYSLFLQAQPGARGRSFTVSVMPPTGYTYQSSSIEPVAVKPGQPVTFDLDLITDTMLVVSMVRVAG
jgi:hypothetical protein